MKFNFLDISLKRFLLILFVSILVFFLVSGFVARSIANKHVRLLGKPVVFYRQMLVINQPEQACVYRGVLWRIYYETDDLSGFYCEVEITLLGNVVYSNVRDYIPTNPKTTPEPKRN